MKAKKSILFVAMALLIMFSFVLFNSCSSKEETDVIPVNADLTPESLVSPEPELEPEPEPEPQSRFDDYVTQYEQENDIKLANAHDSMKYEFFDDIYAQNYIRSFAIEDRETVSEENRLLLDAYINYLDSLHETCNFDQSVQEFIQSNPDIDLTIDPTPLYEYLLSENIDPNDIDTNCNNAYKDGYSSWFRRGGVGDLRDLISDLPDTAIEQSSAEEEERKAAYEAQLQEFEEWERQMEEEADQERAQLIAELDELEYDHADTFNF